MYLFDFSFVSSKQLDQCIHSHTGCICLTFQLRIEHCVCLFAQLEEAAAPCQPHTQGLTQKILPQPSFQLISDILHKIKESYCQNEVIHSSSSYRPPWTQREQLVLSPSGWNKVQIFGWGQITPFQDERKELVRWEGTQEDVPCPRLEGPPGGFSVLLLSFIEKIHF